MIVNPVCPGLVISSLGRSIAQRSALMKLAVPVYAFILGKSADYGARFYLKAARTPENEHVSRNHPLLLRLSWKLIHLAQGRYIQSLFGEEEYRDLAFSNLESDIALQVRKLVWNEIVGELKRAVPALEKFEGI